MNLAARAREIEREHLRQADIAKAKAREAVQQSMGTELVKLSTVSLEWFELMPKQLLNAEQFLDQAERDFQENAFAPFWTSIEKATTQLGIFDTTVLDLGRFSQRHAALSKAYEGSAPKFPISVKSVTGMAAAAATADRMKATYAKRRQTFNSP